MLVYRVCDRAEVEQILKFENFNQVGGLSWEFKNRAHNYLLGYHYMHFFYNKIDVIRWKAFKGRCVCTYDIPDEVLNKYLGSGQYFNFKKKNLDRVIEYAVVADEMKFEYLQKVDLLLETIDYEDFLNGDLDASLVKTIYDVSKPMIRERKKDDFNVSI